MKSVILKAQGQVGYSEVPKPVCGEDQFLVKMDCAVINPSDVIFMKGGQLFGAPTAYPFTPGWEGAGTIVEAGAAHADKGLVGKRCGVRKGSDKNPAAGLSIGGCMAEYAICDMTGIIPLREETTLEQGCALFVNPLSAICLVDRCEVLKAKGVVITAAASQLGRMIIKLLVKKGIKPLCVVRRQEQVDLLKKELNCEYIVNSSDADYPAKMAEMCKELSATVCLECISGSAVGEMLSFMGFGSTCILYGALSEQPAGSINPLKFLGMKQTLESFLLPFYMMGLAPERIKGFYQQVEELCTTDFKTEVNKRFGLHQIEEALAFYHENQTAGKVLLRPDLTE